MGLTLLIVSSVSLLIGVPIAFALGLGGLAALMMTPFPLEVVPQRMLVNLDSFSLMAIPFFIFCGEVMSRGGVSQKLINFANAMVGHFTGGIGMASVVSSTIFAGISGSAAADTAAIGSLLIPAMVDDGYERGTAASLQGCAGALGPIIPPSITMIIYGSLTGMSVASLFLSGFGPGVLIMMGLLAVVYIYAKKRNLKGRGKFSWNALMKAGVDAIWALLLPVIILGGIMTGIFTPTEAGVIASVYAILVSMFVYRQMTLKDLPRIILESAVSTASIAMIVSTASIVAWLLASIRFPQSVAQFLGSISDDKIVIMILSILFILLMGCAIETVALAIIVVPILFPIGNALGMDPLHFGCLIVIALVFAGITPPVGILLFISTRIAKCTFRDTCSKLVPFLAVMFGVLFLCVFVPQIITFIPNLLLGAK